MQEFEAKFINIDVEDVRIKLKKLGFICVKPEFMMVRKAFGIKGNKNKWGRVRDEGDKITMTIKEEDESLGIEGVKEIELVVNDFDTAVEFLNFSGFYEKAYQETKREIWQKDDLEVAIDTWPGLNPFIEVEADSVVKVQNLSKLLDFDMKEAFYGGVGHIYKEIMGLDVNHLPLITFEQPPMQAG